MTTVERLHAQGQRLFAARSVVPLALVPFLMLALPESWRVQSSLGATANRLCLSAALAIRLFRLALQAMAVAFAPDGTSSRDTHQLRATTLTTSGVYSVVRNPLYLGNALMWLGAVASLQVWWLVVVTALAYWLYIERVILVEEAFLGRTFGANFSQWASRTPAFVPKVAQWRPPAGRFSWRRLSTEHNGLLGFLATVTVLRAGAQVAAGGQPVSRWRADHADLLALLMAALALSIVSILAKRLARRTVSKPVSAPAA